MTPNRRLSVPACVLVGLGILVPPSGASGTASAECTIPLAVQGPSHRVTVLSQTECCPQSIGLSVVKETGVITSLEITARIQTLKELRLVGDHRLLLVGELRYGGSDLVVADLDPPRQEAEIWTYGYGISPTGRWLAYQTHYPRMVPPDGRRSIFLLYDLSKPAAENRSGPLSDWPEPNLGALLFPEENLDRRSWKIGEAELAYSLTSPFLWSADERTLVFVVGAHTPLGDLENRSSHVVRVELAEGGVVRRVYQEPLTLENLELPRARVPVADLEGKPILVALESLEWVEDGVHERVQGETSLPGSELGTKVRIRLPGPSPAAAPP